MRPRRDSEPEMAVIASDDLRERARSALEQRFGEATPALGRVERVSVDVVLGTAREIVSLPMYPSMTDVEQDAVCAALRDILSDLER